VNQTAAGEIFLVLGASSHWYLFFGATILAIEKLPYERGSTCQTTLQKTLS